MTKAAIVTFTKGMTPQLDGEEVSASTQSRQDPSGHPFSRAASRPRSSPNSAQEVPLGRPGQPVEIAPVYVLLASQEGSYITGEIYGVTAARIA